MPPRHWYPLLVMILAVWSGGVSRAAEIHTAAREGRLERVRALIDSAAGQVNLADDRDCRPIHFAADGGSVAVVSLLLDLGADIEAVDADGDVPLHWAAIRGRGPAIELLLARGAKVDPRNHHLDTPLLYAVKRLQYDTVELLVGLSADLELPNDYGRTPLLWATREGGDLQMARLLLRLGADVNARDRFGETSLDLAAWRGFRVLVDTFLGHGAELDVEGENAGQLLSHSLERGLTRLYARLTEVGIDVPVEGGVGVPPLHLAAQGGAPAIVRDLLARGAAVDAADAFGYTALHYAAAKGRAAVAEELLSHGAAPDLRTNSGCSALNIAATESHDEVTSVLRQHGADQGPRRFPVLQGAYLGQTPPGGKARLFAPDIVARPWGAHGSITFSPDGREAMWSAAEVTPDSGYGYGTVWTSRIVDGNWTAPRQAPFAEDRGDDVPFFSADGKHLYFISRRPIVPGQRAGDENIWVVERDGWGEPQPLPPAVNDMPQHWQFSVAANGNLYFNSRAGTEETGGLYVSRYTDGRYDTPEFLAIDGSAPFIAPDESYLLFARYSGGGHQLHIALPAAGGGWGESINVTETVNPDVRGMCPIISLDERFIFFVRGNNDIHWVEADFLEEVRRLN